MKFLISCILNILGLIILDFNFNISCSDVWDYLAIIVIGVLLNTAGVVNNS